MYNLFSEIVKVMNSNANEYTMFAYNVDNLSGVTFSMYYMATTVAELTFTEKEFWIVCDMSGTEDVYDISQTILDELYSKACEFMFEVMDGV